MLIKLPWLLLVRFLECCFHPLCDVCLCNSSGGPKKDQSINLEETEKWDLAPGTKEPVREISTLKTHCSFWSPGWRKSLKWNRQFHHFSGKIFIINQTSSPKHQTKMNLEWNPLLPSSAPSSGFRGFFWERFGHSVIVDFELVLGGILLQKIQNSPSEHGTAFFFFFFKEAKCHCPQSLCDAIGKSGSREDFPKIQEKLKGQPKILQRAKRVTLG